MYHNWNFRRNKGNGTIKLFLKSIGNGLVFKFTNFYCYCLKFQDKVEKIGVDFNILLEFSRPSFLENFKVNNNLDSLMLGSRYETFGWLPKYFMIFNEKAESLVGIYLFIY